MSKTTTTITVDPWTGYETTKDKFGHTYYRAPGTATWFPSEREAHFAVLKRFARTI